MKERNNFATKINALCGNDKLRPIFNCVHFKNGFAYATNGQAIIRQSLELSNVLLPENLEGKAIHKNIFKDIFKYDLVQADEEGVNCTTLEETSAFFSYHEIKENVPDFDSMFKNMTTYTTVSFFGVTPELIDLVLQSMYLPSGQMQISFIDGGKKLLCTAPGVDDQHAIIMPVLLQQSIF